MNDVRKASRDLRADPTTPGASDAGDFVAGIWFIVGVIIGCTGWAWGVDSTKLSVPVQWLGQGAAISVGIVVSGSALSRKYLTAWKDFSSVPFKSREYKRRSPRGVILLPQEGIAGSVELDNFDYRLIEYDIETMEELGSLVLDEIRSRPLSDSDFRFSQSGHVAVLPSKREYQLFDSGTGESLLQLKFAKNQTLGLFSMAASHDLQYFVAASDLDHVYVIRLKR